MTSIGNHEDSQSSVCEGCFAQKLLRSLRLICDAYEHFGDRLVVEHSLTKEACVTWELARRVNPKIKGFCVATRFQPPEALQFAKDLLARYPELGIYESFISVSDGLPRSDPDLCCELLRQDPKRWALKVLDVGCLVTGFRRVGHSTAPDLNEIQQVTGDLIELAPLLAWNDADVSRYVDDRRIPLIPLHEQGATAFACKACARSPSGGSVARPPALAGRAASI